MRFRKSVGALLIIALSSTCGFAGADNVAMQPTHSAPAPQQQQKPQDAPLVERYLRDGKLASGETALLAELKTHPNDDRTRLGLGILQFVHAIERLVQDLHRYGLRDPRSHGARLPILRLPAPPNVTPETLSYTKARNIAKTLLDNLTKAETTMVPIKDPDVKVPLHFGMIRLDLNGDGQATEGETLWKLNASLNGNQDITPEQSEKFSICFDRGDVHWLRGYCHLLSSLCEFYLAHDTRETFECTAHLFFPRVESPYGFLAKGKRVTHFGGDDLEFVDLIAFIHLIRWDVVEPQRMEAVLHHLEAVVAQSKESWKWIMAETDDDHEWLPNPTQTGVIPNMKVTPDMVVAWGDMMDQIDKLLAGKVLIPFWRSTDGRGINLRRVFLEPRKFDLVLWVQGPAAAPYLEHGPMTESITWRKLNSTFGHNFPGFAIWFN